MTGGRGDRGKLPVIRPDKGKQPQTYRRRGSSLGRLTGLRDEDSLGQLSPPLSIPPHFFGDSYVSALPARDSEFMRFMATPTGDPYTTGQPSRSAQAPPTGHPSPTPQPSPTGHPSPTAQPSPGIGGSGTLPAGTMDAGCSRGTDSTVGGPARIEIVPRGREFTNQNLVSRHIGKIIESKFTGAWKSYKKVPMDIRDFWFSEFERHFCWTDTHGREARRIFDHIASNALKNRLYDARSRNVRPSWISPVVWVALLLEWSSEPNKAECARNKQNRASDCGGKGFPSHMGGSLTYLTHRDNLRETLGREPTIAEAFMQTHSRIDSQGERVWSDARSEAHHGSYMERYEQRSSDGETSTPIPSLEVQMERWTEMAGGENRGRVYGLAGMASQRHRPSQVYARSEREEQLTTELQTVKSQLDELPKMREELHELRGVRGELDALKAQMAVMMNMMQQRPAVAAPPSFAMPTPGTLYPLLPPRGIPPEDETAEDDDDETQDLS